MRLTFLALVLSLTTSVPTTLLGQANPAPSVARRADVPAGSAKHPAVAHVLGIVPGLGHVYAGEPGRGIAFVGGLVGVTTLASLLVAGDCVTDALSDGGGCEESAVLDAGSVAILAVWGWSIIDAGSAARRTNARRNGAALTVAMAQRPTATGQGARALKVGLRLPLR